MVSFSLFSIHFFEIVEVSQSNETQSVALIVCVLRVMEHTLENRESGFSFSSFLFNYFGAAACLFLTWFLSLSFYREATMLSLTQGSSTATHHGKPP